MHRIILLLPFLLLISCKSSQTSLYEELDLLSYGMPIAIKAPPGAEVKKEDLGVIQSIIVTGDKYDVQIYSSKTMTLNLEKVKQEKLREVKEGRYFSKVLEEEDDGFIFEKDIDGIIRYDFRRIKLIGDTEFSFQKGLMGNFSEEEIRYMYEAVK